jgi:hypothetical protein
VPHSTRPSAALGPVPHSAHAVTRPCARACVARESARGCAGELGRMGARAPRLHDCVRLWVCVCACVRVCVCVGGVCALLCVRAATCGDELNRSASLLGLGASALAHSYGQRSRNASAALTPRHPSGCMLHPFVACCILSLHVASFRCMLHPVSGRMCYACCCRGGLCLRRAWRLATRAVLRTARHSFWRPSHGAFCMGFCGMSHGRAVTRS